VDQASAQATACQNLACHLRDEDSEAFRGFVRIDLTTFDYNNLYSPNKWPDISKKQQKTKEINYAIQYKVIHKAIRTLVSSSAEDAFVFELSQAPSDFSFQRAL